MVAETLSHPFDGYLWAPQAGPQFCATIAPVDVLLYGGARGGGKTDCALGRQILGALRHGRKWHGLFIRKNYKHFAELRRRIVGLILLGLPAVLIGGEQQTNFLRFDNGAVVMLTAVQRAEQLEFFQGQQFTEISVEEGTQFPFFAELVDKLKGCLRSPDGVPCRMFITANPGGPGHSIVKALFLDGRIPNKAYRDEFGETTAFVPSRVDDNLVLLEADPKYRARLESIRDPALRRAWLEGDWDVVLGGFFSDVIDRRKQMPPPFRPPLDWSRYMGFDWGSAHPFSVGWYAVSDGTQPAGVPWRFPRGSLIRYREWYGNVPDWQHRPNVGVRMESVAIAEQIRATEEKHAEALCRWDRIADPSIFAEEDGPSIAEKMAGKGVVFRRADNKRLPGWDEVRARLRGGAEGKPKLYVTENCLHWWRTVPVLDRDPVDWEDVDTDQEDHPADETRYVCMARTILRPSPKRIREMEEADRFEPFDEAAGY